MPKLTGDLLDASRFGVAPVFHPNPIHGRSPVRFGRRRVNLHIGLRALVRRRHRKLSVEHRWCTVGGPPRDAILANMDYDEDDPLYEAKMIDDFIEGKIQMTPYLELEKRGQAPPMIDQLSDTDVTRELTNLLWGFEDLGIYVESIDHLDDRAAYQLLLDYCDKPNMFFPGNKSASVHFSPIDTGSDEDTEIYLRYYADEATRERWAMDYGDPLPPSELPPYPRPWIPKWNPCCQDCDHEDDSEGGE